MISSKKEILIKNGLFFIRLAIGWLFLYEGILKLIDPSWTSAAYLSQSKWLFSGLFHWIVGNETALHVVDLLNIWGLLLIGAGLLLGFLTRIASVSGIILLLLYYIANPPFVGYPGMAGEGNYLLINKDLIQIGILLLFSFLPAAYLPGLDRIFNNLWLKKQILPGDETAEVKQETADSSGFPAQSNLDRREILKSLISIPVLGLFSYFLYRRKQWQSFEEKYLLEKKYEVDARHNRLDGNTSATIKTQTFSNLKDLAGKIPKTKLANLEVSRVIMGGNLIGGWAHSRDLIYVSNLVKKYHTDEKVMDTLELAERCGINALITNPQLLRVINKYWRSRGGKIQLISDCGIYADVLKGVELSIEGGASTCYVQGGICDRLVAENKFDTIHKALEIMRENNVPAGIGAHDIETIKAVVEKQIKPDFWVKTLHHHDYWSSNNEDRHDNIWCYNPQETIEFMNGLEEPWIAFKILAAGAIHPKVGFDYAFKHGADFICVGMYDFQIIDDVNIALKALEANQIRRRPWRA